MGILDEAIREHLELKRSHGADESELDGLQAEAFGPADRPDAVEAETQVISPGEGDQLDRVFEATREAEKAGESELPTGEATETAEPAEPAASVGEEPTVAEHVIPSPSAEATETELSADDAIHVADTAEAGPPEPAADQNFDDVEGGDAGDALQRERMTLSGHPTEHYDVDAAIAEEQEIDILSESSLSDELDRALDGPDDAAPAEPAAAPAAPTEMAAPAESALPEDPVSDEPEAGLEDESEEAKEPEEAEAVPEEPEVEFEPEGAGAEPIEETDESAEDAEFFDQDDPLEATPDFLEETPEHDRLWFEQKPPKDFEFGD